MHGMNIKIISSVIMIGLFTPEKAGFDLHQIYTYNICIRSNSYLTENPACFHSKDQSINAIRASSLMYVQCRDRNNTVWGQNAELLNATACGIYNYHPTLTR